VRCHVWTKPRSTSKRKIPMTATTLSRRMKLAATTRRSKEPRQIDPVRVADGPAPCRPTVHGEVSHARVGKSSGPAS
jgi:hypothetical protein